jgi:hypothetical protein
MSDGPFRNLPLSSRWQRYGEDLVSDAASLEERAAQVCHSMLGDVDLKEFSSLWSALQANTQRPQMDLDPISSIDAIFDGHPRSRLTDTLQKHLAANLRDQMPPGTALDQALAGTVRDWIGAAKNRLDEHCILARDLGDMSREDYRKGIERNRETFAAIKVGDLCNALTCGNKRAFSQALRKKSGVDEGPDE